MSVFQTFFEIGSAISLSLLLFVWFPVYFMFVRKLKRR